MKKWILYLSALAMIISVWCVSIQKVSADVPTEMLFTQQDEIAYTSSAGTYLWKTAFKLVQWALVKADNSLFYRAPEINDPGGNWVSSNSGSVTFGNGTSDVRRVKFTTNVSEAHNHLDVFAQTNVLNWLGTITIFIENSAGVEVYGGQVGHNQHIFTSYDLPLDTYYTYYVCSNSKKWDCWITRYDFSADYSGNALNESMAASNMIYNPQTNKSYIIPSYQDTSNKKDIGKATLSAQDLVEEFYDKELKCSVNRLANYDIGDSIVVTDVIEDLEYDAAKDITTIYYGETAEGSFAWPFNGDLRKRFKEGDELSFGFSVVEECFLGGYSFETLDYFLYSYDVLATGHALDIDKYLIESKCKEIELEKE